MGNLGFKIKRFFQNKNTVTIIGLILAIAILGFGYNYRVQQAINPIKNIPYAKVTIQPRTKITDDMIGYTNIPPAMLMGDIIKSGNNIIGKWSNYNTMIPKGSLFFEDTVVTISELPDSAFVNIEEGYTAYNLSVDTKSTYGNSIFPGNYIDLYFKALNADGKIIVGKLISNIKILAVKDKNGNHVFENTQDTKTPSIIIFAVPEEMHIMLRKASYLANVKSVSAELIPVPSTESYSTEPGSITLTSQYLKAFIEVNTGFIEEQ